MDHPFRVIRGGNAAPKLVRLLMQASLADKGMERKPWDGSFPARIRVFYDGDYCQLGLRWIRNQVGADFGIGNLTDYLADPEDSNVELVGAHFYCAGQEKDDAWFESRKRTREIREERDIQGPFFSRLGTPDERTSKAENPRNPSCRKRHLLPDDELLGMLDEGGVDAHLRLWSPVSRFFCWLEMTHALCDGALADEYDVAIVVAGNSVYVPAVRHVTRIVGKRLMVAYFDIPNWRDETGRLLYGCHYSPDLNAEASLSFDLIDQLIEVVDETV